MKNLTKNFIAFTLSEMMIVLLILSVISAATLPAITQRSEVKPRVTASKWSYDYYRNKGYFYNTNTSSTDVIIGFPSLQNATAAQKTSLQNSKKNASLRLVRPNYILKKVNDNMSTIAFFSRGGKYRGKIAVADSNSNIAIGQDVIKNPANRNGSISIYIGSYAAENLKPLGDYPGHNVVVGYNAAGSNKSIANSYSTLGSDNVVMGSNIFVTPIGDRNVIMGAYATSHTGVITPSEFTLRDVIAIGAYSMYNATYSLSSINVGYRAGASTLGSYFNNCINIGSYAGQGVTHSTSGNSRTVVNIGYKAGVVYNGEQIYAHSVNIGSYASYGSNGHGVNIGAYANAFNTYSDSSDSGSPAVNIGYYAGAKTEISSPQDTVNIGNYAGHGSRNGNWKNIHIGYYSGAYVGNSAINITIGNYSGYQNDLSHSVAIGAYAGYKAKNNMFFEGSVFVGRYAGYSSSYSSVVVGCYGLTSISGAKKMCIGGAYPGNNKGGWNSTGSTVSTLITPYTGSNWAGTGIYLLAKNVVSFGGTLTAFSDRTLKENIVKTKYGIDKLRQVNIYQYNFKGEKDKKIGVIAQELQNVYPEAVSKSSNNYLVFSADWIVYSMVQALKDVDNAVMNLQKELSVNIRSVKNIAVKVSSLEYKLNRLSKNNNSNKIKLAEIDVILSKMERK